MQTPLLAFNQNGIYCAAADVYLDPWRKVDKAIITRPFALGKQEIHHPPQQYPNYETPLG